MKSLLSAQLLEFDDILITLESVCALVLIKRMRVVSKGKRSQIHSASGKLVKERARLLFPVSWSLSNSGRLIWAVSLIMDATLLPTLPGSATGNRERARWRGFAGP